LPPLCLNRKTELCFSSFLSVDNSVFEYDLRQAEAPIIRHVSRDLTEELQCDDEVNQLCVSKHRLVAAADDSGTVRIWDGQRTRILKPETDGPFLMTSCCFRSGDQLASGGTNCAVYLWDIGRPRRPLDTLIIARDDVGANQMCNPPMVHSLSWSPSGRLLTAGLGDGSIQVMGVVKKKLMARTRLRDGHGSSVATLCFPDFGANTGANTDRILASAGTDGAILVWDLKRSIGGDASVDPRQILSHDLVMEDLSEEPIILFGIPHPHKANCMVSSRTNTLYVADTSNEITGYTIPLHES
jgi:WD repeat-containing protein 53